MDDEGSLDFKVVFSDSGCLDLMLTLIVANN